MHYDRIADELVREILAEASRREWSRLELDAKTGRWNGYWSAVKAGRKRFEVVDLIDAAKAFGTTPSQIVASAEFRTEPALLEHAASSDFDLRRVVQELSVVKARLRRMEEQTENGG